MINSKAILIQKNEGALRVAASCARISTQQGTAMEIYAKGSDEAKNLNLIGKVLASGHKSVIEHQTMSVAFNDVSVMAEQFIIEFRLASYTVKSRRYVDFSDAGYVIPQHFEGEAKAAYSRAMEARFADYCRLLEMGVPKEDARFVLPYCLRSNFYMTCDAREMINLICSMAYGRGSRFAELKSLGEQLKAQFDEMYPGVIDGEKAKYTVCLPEKLPARAAAGKPEKGGAELISAAANAESMLAMAMEFSGRFEAENGKWLTRKNLYALLTDARPRELEMLSYVFKVKNISLSCLTHFARHRIQSPIIPNVVNALAKGDFVVPESVKAIPEAEKVYMEAFEKQAEAANEAIAMGIACEDLTYYALSGHQIDILMRMNAREILHFMKLRTCSRAQWEIREVAKCMLALLRECTPEIFNGFGPSCALGKCPEGKMTCGKPVKNYFES